VGNPAGSDGLHLCLVQLLNLDLAYRQPGWLLLKETLTYRPRGRLSMTWPTS